MTREITMPQLGFTMVEGTVVEWYRHQGEQVNKGDVLLEVSTEKISTDVEAPVSGVVQEILVPAGATVPVGTPICLVAVAEETSALSPSPLRDLGVGADSRVGPAAPSPAPDAESGRDAESTSGTAVPAGESTPNRIKASGVAKRLARERGLSLSDLSGSGPGGRILGADVQRYLAGVASSHQSSDISHPHPKSLPEGEGVIPRSPTQHASHSTRHPRPGRRVPFTGARRIIADRMHRSARETADVTLVAEVDVSEAVRLRGELLPEWERAYGVRITFNDLVVKACGQALRDHPALNATLDGEDIVQLDEVNVGIAVALDDGLIVPVLRGADIKPLRAIAAESRDLVQRARSRGLSPDEVTGGSFTVTNLGSHGIDFFTPIINPGETAILGVGRVAERPAVFQGEICKRSMMYLSLVFDHRLADGAPAARFLDRIRDILERPYLLLT